MYAGNFVVAGYGTGAVMAVPGHDQRDFDFAKAYDLEIRRVLVQKSGETKFLINTKLRACMTIHLWVVLSLKWQTILTIIYL